MISAKVLGAISKERISQDLKWGANRELSDRTWITVLLEEVGEVAHASLEHDPAGMEMELVQVAAVAIAWLEAIQRKE